MASHTEKVFYVFSALDQANVFRCYFDTSTGGAFALKLRPLLPLASQIIDDLLVRFPTLEQVRCHFVPFFREALNESEKLYLILYDKNLGLPGGIVWPEFLKSLPKTRERLAFLKAFQVVMGTHKENIKALDPQDLKPLNGDLQ